MPNVVLFVTITTNAALVMTNATVTVSNSV